MKWAMKVQKIGRIQIPSTYLHAYDIKEGDIVLIEEEGEKKLLLSFGVGKKDRLKKKKL
ncbi:hypothetical protein J4458_03110 [Candidatus Woesearchaeota archaeon]|nr:hypothetical protein [Candidatus Woesearchaeota archaeon]